MRRKNNTPKEIEGAEDYIAVKINPRGVAFEVDIHADTLESERRLRALAKVLTSQLTLGGENIRRIA